MSLRISWLPTIGAILFLIVTCLSSANAQQFSAPTGYLLMSDIPRTDSPISRKKQTAPAVVESFGNIILPVVSGLHNYALYSGMELNRRVADTDWIASQLHPSGDRYIFAGVELQGFEPVPPLETVVSGLQITGQTTRMAFFDEDISKPAASKTELPPSPSQSTTQQAMDHHHRKAVGRREGRLVLKNGISVSGWRLRTPSAGGHASGAAEVPVVVPAPVEPTLPQD